MKFFTGSLPARPSLRIRRAAASHRVDPTHGRALRSAGLFPAGRASLAVLASLAIALQASAVKSASSKPPLSPDADAAAVTSSTVSATLEFGLEAIAHLAEPMSRASARNGGCCAEPPPAHPYRQGSKAYDWSAFEFLQHFPLISKVEMIVPPLTDSISVLTVSLKPNG
jgi:hypothetical protein